MMWPFSILVLGRRYLTRIGVAGLRTAMGMAPMRRPEPGETMDEYKAYMSLVRRETLQAAPPDLAASFLDGRPSGPKEWSPRGHRKQDQCDDTRR
jgi:hypothetical protein